MVALNSTMMPLGTVAPDFTLSDVITGNSIALQDVKSNNATVIMFICNHCPYVVHIQDELVALANDYQPQGVTFLAICSNDSVKYPDDAPERMQAVALEKGYPFPYLHDETQNVARAYDAQCTPDFFVFDADLKCAYRGQMDDSRPGNEIPVTGADLRRALDALINGHEVLSEQKPSVGCSIKWA